MIHHLYVHIPFCARICPYCAFYKEKLDRTQTTRFCQAIVAEIEGLTTQFSIKPRSIFLGGGTPSALTSEQLQFLLEGVARNLDLSELAEFTLEANPGSVSLAKARLLHRLGISRISLGIQSWDDALLKLLGREHSAAQAEESFYLLRQAGFSNINMALMFAMAMATLEDAGYVHYEISNYARPGFDSVHNRAYWQGRDYLGIGPSSFSTVGLRRWQNVADYRAYSDRILSGTSAVASVEDLTLEMKRIERVALGLRTRNGILAADLANWPEQIAEFVQLGLLTRSNDSFVLTRAGKSLADSVASAFV